MYNNILYFIRQPYSETYSVICHRFGKISILGQRLLSFLPVSQFNYSKSLVTYEFSLSWKFSQNYHTQSSQPKQPIHKALHKCIGSANHRSFHQFFIFSDMINCNLIENNNNTENTEISSESEDDVDVLFPNIHTQKVKASVQLLAKQFNPHKHARQLTHYCFRCHQHVIAESYGQFRRQYYPELTEPQISSFFTNESFINLLQLGQAFQQGSGQYPGLHIAPVPKTLKKLLDQIFEADGYLPNLQRFLLFYPSYLQKHMALKNNLFQSDKIDRKIGYFLAFNAAAEMGSIYMLARYYRCFIKVGGDQKWVKDGKYPPKYRLLLGLNRSLARAVWQINEDSIAEILEGPHWTKSELALCLQIMAFAQQNSTLALAMGLALEQSIDCLQNLLNVQGARNVIEEYQCRIFAASSTKQSLAVIVPIINEYEQQQTQLKNKSEGYERKKVLKRSLWKEGEEEVEPYMKSIGEQLSKQELNESLCLNLHPLLPTHRVIEKRREHLYPIIDYSDYNFTFMAYPLLNSLTQNTADILMNLITYSESMTRDNFGNEKVCNTKEFRRAMRYYSENLCGYRHHEYEYKQNISCFLTIALKFYIRLLTLSPVHITQQVIREMNHESGQIQCFDIGHVAILIATTKMSLVLTLAMHSFDV